MRTQIRFIVSSAGVVATAGLLAAALPVGSSAAAADAVAPVEAVAQAPAGGGAGQAGGGQGRGGRGSEPATMLFRETWATVMAQPIVQESISNTSLVLHVYGDPSEIRKTTHAAQDEHYTYTGETTTNWALTLSDPNNYWDLSGDGRFRMQTRNSGFRTTHIVIKTADGDYYASEEGNPDSTAWIVRDYIFRDLTWRRLLMTDTPTNASNNREPDAARVPIIALERATPDLSRIEEVGFSDLSEGGWIPSTSRVRSWEVWGKAVPR